MHFAIIVSKKDIAGMNIRKNLLEMFDFSENGEFPGSKTYSLNSDKNMVTLYTIDGDTIVFEAAEQEIEADYFIFATRHQSKSGEKTLSVHFPGNFGEASDYGGRTGELCTAPAGLLKEGFKLLSASEDIGFSITLEAKHHGPFIRKPVLFIEIGSREEQWSDARAGKITAKIIIEMIKNYNPEKKYETAIGFGGTHYCNSFNRAEASREIAMSHICPKHSISQLDETMVKKMIDSTHEKVDYALIDWKGMSADDRNRVIGILDNLGVEWKKTKGLGTE